MRERFGVDREGQARDGSGTAEGEEGGMKDEGSLPRGRDRRQDGTKCNEPRAEASEGARA